MSGKFLVLQTYI